MKKITLRAAFSILCYTVAFFMAVGVSAQNEVYTGAKSPQSIQAVEKPIVDNTYKYLPPSGREVVGEDIATAIPIPGMPFYDTGNTCAHLNDYDEACPYTGSTAPDVVYSYTPTENQTIVINLCASLYDTKVYIYENVEGNLIACNDDFCNLMSAIQGLDLAAGNTYYIVIDGFGTDCGDYVLDMYTLMCQDCLPCSIPEGEADIPDYGVDVVNGGCNQLSNDPPTDPIFSPIQLGQVVCGRSNTYIGPDGGDFRDTDWYEITLEEAGTLYWSGYAIFNMQLVILNTDCNNLITYDIGSSGGACQILQISADLPAGTYYLWAGPAFFTGLAGGANYNVIATLNAPPPEEWCSNMVPVSNWALYLAIGLIAMFIVFSIWKR